MGGFNNHDKTMMITCFFLFLGHLEYDDLSHMGMKHDVTKSASYNQLGSLGKCPLYSTLDS